MLTFRLLEKIIDYSQNISIGHHLSTKVYNYYVHGYKLGVNIIKIIIIKFYQIQGSFLLLFIGIQDNLPNFKKCSPVLIY